MDIVILITLIFLFILRGGVGGEGVRIREEGDVWGGEASQIFV